jgi:hypothetical protein
MRLGVLSPSWPLFDQIYPTPPRPKHRTSFILSWLPTKMDGVVPQNELRNQQRPQLP